MGNIVGFRVLGFKGLGFRGVIQVYIGITENNMESTGIIGVV